MHSPSSSGIRPAPLVASNHSTQLRGNPPAATSAGASIASVNNNSLLSPTGERSAPVPVEIGDPSLVAENIRTISSGAEQPNGGIDANVVNAIKNGGNTPLKLAVMGDHTRTVKILVDRGADVNRGAPLVMGAYNGNGDIVKILLEAGANVEARADFDGESMTALQRAERSGHEKIAEILRAHGAGSIPSHN